MRIRIVREPGLHGLHDSGPLAIAGNQIHRKFQGTQGDLKNILCRDLTYRVVSKSLTYTALDGAFLGM